MQKFLVFCSKTSVFLCCTFLLACGGTNDNIIIDLGSSGAPAPQATPSPSPASTPTVSPSPVSTPTSIATVTPSATPTSMPSTPTPTPTPTDTPDVVPTTLLRLNNQGEIRLAPFSPPEQTYPIDFDNAEFILASGKTASQRLLSSAQSKMTHDEIVRFRNLLPHPELFCNDPHNSDYQNIAQDLGGFIKPSSIQIEVDASQPHILSGFEVYAPPQPAPDIVNTVNLSRPDLIGVRDNTVYYLSKIYGLIAVDFSGMPSTQPQVSCGYLLPGNPKNFVITNDHLMVITESLNGFHSAVLRFSIANNTPEFVDAVSLKFKRITDARLFNDRLALYIQNYEEIDLPNYDEDVEVVIYGILPPPPYRPIPKVISRELAVMDTQPDLQLVYQDTLLDRNDHSSANAPDIDPETTRFYSYFNNFLSASGEYLVITETIRESNFSHYETHTVSHCNDWEIMQESYEYCQVSWERVENPDYIPVSDTGVVACAGTLHECLQYQAPTMSRYIHIATGSQCSDRIKANYQCLASDNRQLEVPYYTDHVYTSFNVYHFNQGQFIRLDDQLVQVDEEHNSLLQTDEAFQVAGVVEHHDHMRFQHGQFYVISRDAHEKTLSTFSLLGNTAAKVAALPLQFGSEYAPTVLYTDDKLLFSSHTGWNSQEQESILQSISLTNPLKPVPENDLRIPTNLDQMVFFEDTMLAVGTTRLNRDTPNEKILGTATAFHVPSSGGRVSETNSVILGGNYARFYSGINHNDQVLAIDKPNQRVFLPYQLFKSDDPADTSRISSRLSLLDIEDGQVHEEHTFSLPSMPLRSIGVSEQAALAFNDSHIFSLSKNDDWQNQVVFNGQLPYSIYYAKNSPIQVQKYLHEEAIELRLIASADSAHGELIDQLQVSYPPSVNCVYPNLFFDGDRVISVRAKSGIYHTVNDCPSSWTDTDLEWSGYRFDSSGFTEIEDQSEMMALYQQIKWYMHCVVNPELADMEHSSLSTLPEDTAGMRCYTFEQYNQEVSRMRQLIGQ